MAFAGGLQQTPRTKWQVVICANRPIPRSVSAGRWGWSGLRAALLEGVASCVDSVDCLLGVGHHKASCSNPKVRMSAALLACASCYPFECANTNQSKQVRRGSSASTLHCNPRGMWVARSGRQHSTAPRVAMHLASASNLYKDADTIHLRCMRPSMLAFSY